MLKLIRNHPIIMYLLYIIIPFILANVQRTSLAKDIDTPLSIQTVFASTAVNAQGTVLIGLELAIADGWKIYAPSPHNYNTDNDLTARHPQFVWSNQTNISDIIIKWPQANYIHENNIQIPTYNRRVVIPLELKVIDVNQSIQLDGMISLICCSNQCLPIEYPLSIYMPAGQGTATKYTSELNTLMTQIHNSTIAPFNSTTTQESLLWMLLIAFIGGVILNFMPCVLPVISLKLKFLVANHSATYRLNFIATICGIMTSFMMFAAMAIALRQSGHVFGWGSHFQQPYFIVIMCIIMVIFACNIWGYMELTLPTIARSALNRIANLKFDQSQVVVEGFISGIIATLLATPCTAPFLGTAIGYALSQNNFETIVLFAILGLGFSLPYLLALIIPLKYLWTPKPGLWMMQLNKLLAWGLIGSVIWLLWVLEKTKGLTATLLVGLLLSLIITIVYFIKPGNRWRHLIWMCILNILLCTCYFQQPHHRSVSYVASEYWQPFDEEAIDQAVRDHKIVFLDVTASWCTTCHVNKLMVLNRDTFKKYLSSSQIVAMRADWTSHDPKIGHFLAKHHRHGIPFNIVYGPNAPHGILLPEILNLDDIVQAFHKAGF